MPGVGLPDHMLAVFLFLFYRTSIQFSTVAVPIYIPTNGERGSLFFSPSLAFIVCRLFDDDHSDQCEVIPNGSFYLHFSNNYQCCASFHMPFGLLWRNVYLGLLPIF